MHSLRVALLTHRLPFAPNRGDRLRAYHQLRMMNAQKAEVHIISLVHDPEEAAEANRLAALAASVTVAPVPRFTNRVRALRALWFSPTPLTHLLLHSPSLQPAAEHCATQVRPDVVLAFCSSMAKFAMEPPLDRFPLVIDMVDADSAKWAALASVTRWPMSLVYKREARTLAAFETRAMLRAHATVAVNEREVALLRKLAPEARIQVLENGVDLDGFAPPDPPRNSCRVVFCGVMDYAPNEAGAVWLAREIWPHVRKVVPSAELRIVGASPTPRVVALAAPTKGVTVTGSVPDVRPELWAAAVATAPLRTARGVQNKVLEAVAAGLPCVVTPVVHAGLPAEVVPACSVADTTQAFADAIAGLLQRSTHERRSLAAVDLRSLSWSARLAPLLPLLRDASLARGH